MIVEAIGLGLLFSLIFVETIGLAAGGMVVPGYISLMLHHPLRVLGTVIVSLLTLAALKVLSRYIFIYGRRRLVAVIVIGFLLGWLSKRFFILTLPGFSLEMQSIGYIIPGLIAYWMERQGPIPTLSMMITVSILIRIVLILISGGEILS